MTTKDDIRKMVRENAEFMERVLWALAENAEGIEPRPWHEIKLELDIEDTRPQCHHCYCQIGNPPQSTATGPGGPIHATCCKCGDRMAVVSYKV